MRRQLYEGRFVLRDFREIDICPAHSLLKRRLPRGRPASLSARMPVAGRSGQLYLRSTSGTSFPLRGLALKRPSPSFPHHLGIGLMTPDQVHHGQADEVHDTRLKILDRAFRDNPNRFVNK